MCRLSEILAKDYEETSQIEREYALEETQREYNLIKMGVPNTKTNLKIAIMSKILNKWDNDEKVYWLVRRFWGF